MTDLERYTKLKSQIDSMRQAADKAQGALDQVMKELRQTFGVSSLEEAETLLKKLRMREKRTNELFTKVLRRFEKQWGGLLDKP